MATEVKLVSSSAPSLSALLPLAGGTMTGNISHASDFTLDVGGDIVLDAAGGDIILKNDGSTNGNIVLGDATEPTVKITSGFGVVLDTTSTAEISFQTASGSSSGIAAKISGNSIVANLKGSGDTQSSTGLIIHGGGTANQTEGGVGGQTNTFESQMNRQIVLKYQTSSSSYAHAIHTRHNSGGRGGNAIDFYNWEYGTDAASALPTKRSFSIHPKAIELVPTTTAEREELGQTNLAYDGMMIYNSTVKNFQGRVDGKWVNFKNDDEYPVTNGLYYRYTGESYVYNGTSTTPAFNDTSGNDRNITSTSTNNGGGYFERDPGTGTWPTVGMNTAGTNGANNEFKYVRFGTDHGLALPDDSNIASGAASGFTFAYVARYNGGTRERIMQANGSNNLIGFWDGNRGVFFDGAWLVGPTTNHSTDQDDWCIIVMRSSLGTSKTKDNNSGNFVENTFTHNYGGGSYVASSFRYGLNAGTYSTIGSSSTEQSNFDLAEIAFFNRDLTDAEIDSVQNFLETKYGI